VGRAHGGQYDSETMVAVDMIGAGIGDDVLVTKGSVARNSIREKDSPVDAVVVGIIDSVEVDERFLESGPAKAPGERRSSRKARS
jgi:ethanolamine utilization protein EutN